MTQGRILLVTDGVDRIVDVSMDASPNFPISILGIGTPEGAPIPLDFVDQPGRFLTDQARQHHRCQARRRTPRSARADVQRPLPHGWRRRLQSRPVARNAASIRRRPAPSRRQVRPLGRLRILARTAADPLRPAELPARRRGIVGVCVAAATGARELVDRPVEHARSTRLQGVAAGRTGTRGYAVRKSAMARRGRLSQRQLRRRRPKVLRRWFACRAATTAATRWRTRESTTKPSPRTTKHCAPSPTMRTPHSTKRCCRSCATRNNPKTVTTTNRSATATSRNRTSHASRTRPAIRKQEESQSGSQEQTSKRPETKQQKSDQEQSQPSDEDKQQTARARSTARRATRRARAMAAARA